VRAAGPQTIDTRAQHQLGYPSFILHPSALIICHSSFPMSLLDYAVIALYFAIVIGIGFWYQRRASKSLQSYFLAGKSMHWLALAMSGSVATFDITGTMWIVTLLTLFGMKSMWNHWMWGFLMAAFFMSYMGKWVRRSNVMTGAEWMVTRFGDGRDGRIARLAYTVLAVVMLAGFIGYAFQGIGKFAAVYVDLGAVADSLAGAPPIVASFAHDLAQHEVEVCAVVIFAVTTLYVLLGGLYGVVATNVLQTVILTVASILIALVAYCHLTPEMLAEVAPVDQTSMTSLAPHWHLPSSADLPTEYAIYAFFGPLVMMWVIKGLLLNLGGPGQMTDFQAFLATRSARDASKLGAAWSGFLVVRWAMCMGIALLALTGLAQARDPEQVMPMVLQEYLPMGARGLVIAGLLAAFMSTFSATVNAAASYVVRDLWQPLFARQASERHLVWASYAATVGVVAVGMLIGFQADSIREVWDWIMMAVGAAFVVPNVLRWYWWRLNGWGYATGTVVGMLAALALPVSLKLAALWHLPLENGEALPWGPGLFHYLNRPYVAFPVVCSLSVVACLVGTWVTRPTDESVLIAFFRSVRPFGFWGPIRNRCGLAREAVNEPGESAVLAAVNVVLSGVVVLGAYLAPMYLVGHWHLHAAACLAVAIAAAVPLYFTWYRNLPPAE
jgi:Na+/proline symporter